jgi:hypothetical protein
MSPTSKREYLTAVRLRYAQAAKPAKSQILDEVCATLRCHRKSAIRLLTGPPPRQPTHQRPGKLLYGAPTITVLRAIWEAAGYPWSVRLKALLRLWLPWAQQRWTIPPALERQLLAISPRTIDRRLQAHKHQLRSRQYGRTKPGALLKHHIPIQAGRWDVTTPGFGEIDLVAHCGPSLDGEHCWSLNFTDLATTWVETWAVLGRHQRGVHHAIDDIAQALPFALRGLDSDNDVAFINHHLVRYCQAHSIQFTRSRPYKKDDNAHIEQKNWTHVRRLLGWDRYETRETCDAINDLYRHEWRLMMNLFQPSVKLLRKVRIGSRLKRVYDPPQTPLDRLLASGQGDSAKVQALVELRQRLDPFALAEAIERKLTRIYRLARSPQRSQVSRTERAALDEVDAWASPSPSAGASARLKQRPVSVTPSMAR